MAQELANISLTQKKRGPNRLVIHAWLESEVRTNEYAIGPVFDKWEDRTDDEAKRVLYVGITRARAFCAVVVPDPFNDTVLSILEREPRLMTRLGRRRELVYANRLLGGGADWNTRRQNLSTTLSRTKR